MDTDVFEISFPSDTYRVKQVVLNLMKFIKLHVPVISEEDAGDLKLIFSELLYNATIHGNDRDITKRVSVKVEILNGVIHCIITDEGAGFDYLKHISEMDKNKNLYSDSGRGIRLVYSLTDSIAFNVRGNEIKFYKRVTTDG